MNDAVPGKCVCGSADCWPADDYSWLASQSGWHGILHGCCSSVFFIHGKKIREQRHLPEGSWSVSELPGLFSEWAAGLPNARLCWSTDTGGGDAGLWIEGERDPNDDDLARLDQCRQRQDRDDRRTWEQLQRRYGQPPAG